MVIGGGHLNYVRGRQAVISGGDLNAVTVCVNGVVLGGYYNHVMGNYSVVPGGNRNRVYGPSSIAMVCM